MHLPWVDRKFKRTKRKNTLQNALHSIGQADDLGGGGIKKRLNDNMHRSIILAKTRNYWIYAYLYAKKDRENIAPDELAAFKRLAKDYANPTGAKIAQSLLAKELVEICHDC